MRPPSLTFLIAHGATEDGANPAQAKIPATSEASALIKFRDQYPGRHVLAVGIEGVQG